MYFYNNLCVIVIENYTWDFIHSLKYRMDRDEMKPPPSSNKTALFYLFYLFSLLDCIDCLKQSSSKTYPLSPEEMSIKSRLYEKYSEPNDDDIRVVRTSLNIIFSNYCPGYLHAKMLNKIDVSINPSLYFYSVFSNVSSIKNIEVTDKISKTFIDIISCVLECIEQKELKKWKEIFVYYKLHDFDDEDFYLLGEILFITLCTVLIENEDSAVIVSWKKVFWGILWRAKCYSKNRDPIKKRVHFATNNESSRSNTPFYGATA